MTGSVTPAAPKPTCVKQSPVDNSENASICQQNRNFLRNAIQKCALPPVIFLPSSPYPCQPLLGQHHSYFGRGKQGAGTCFGDPHDAQTRKALLPNLDYPTSSQRRPQHLSWCFPFMAHFVTERHHAALITFHLRQMECDVSAQLFEEGDSLTDQDRQDGITNFFGQSETQALA